MRVVIEEVHAVEEAVAHEVHAVEEAVAHEVHAVAEAVASAARISTRRGSEATHVVSERLGSVAEHHHHHHPN